MKKMIIGGGLSGLALANALEAKSREYLLIESQHRFGGCIMTEQHEASPFDMGPTWFLPRSTAHRRAYRPIGL
jgi:monoamine oxidase